MSLLFFLMPKQIYVKFNTYVVKVLGTPVSGQGGSLWTLTQKTHFPKEFLTKLSIYQDYSVSETLILMKEKLKNNILFRK